MYSIYVEQSAKRHLDEENTYDKQAEKIIEAVNIDERKM